MWFDNAALVLSSFAYPPAPGVAAATSRFSDGSYGVWYAASTIAAAQAEVAHHMRRARQAGQLPDVPHPRLVLGAMLAPTCGLVDLRGPTTPPGVLDPEDYGIAQRLGAACRASDQWGLVWVSVRQPSALCVGVLRPPVVASVWVEAPCVATWDGNRYDWR